VGRAFLVLLALAAFLVMGVAGARSVTQLGRKLIVSPRSLGRFVGTQFDTSREDTMRQSARLLAEVEMAGPCYN